jgi:cellobiose phosphorylase
VSAQRYNRKNKTASNRSNFGYFSNAGKEFVVTSPKTPRPWVNVVSNGDAGFIISQTGGGYSWRGNGQLNRITRWDQDIVKDEWGKYIYIRDVDTGSIWSAAWKPVCAELERYQVRYGAGYALITARYAGIETEWLLLVAPDDAVELWRLSIRNRTNRQRRLQVFTYFEWCLGAAPDWHREFHKCFVETSFDIANNLLLATKRLWEVPSPNGHWNVDWPYVAFHSVNVRPSAFDCSKENVLGLYGSVSSPEAVSCGKLKMASGNLLDPIASLQININLRPKKEQILTFTLGAASGRGEVVKLTRKYHQLCEVNAAFESTKQRWDELLCVSSVETPDESMNLMLNRWLKYQAIAGRLWGRTGYYQAGGAFGFRDQLQDSQIFLHIDPEQTKKQILLHASHQFRDGTVYHWWHPLSEVGLQTQMTDDLLWLPFLVHQYVEETNDISLLHCWEHFVDDPTGASLYEHCIRSIEKVLSRLSPRGLALIGAGDWNDGLSAVGLEWKGESVWLSQFLYYILKKFTGIMESLDDKERAEGYLRCAKALREAINKYGWDGDWYFYGTKDSGEKLGSKENVEGRIHLNPQTWAVIAEVADGERAEAAMNAVEKYLESDAGPLLLHPAYKSPDAKIGYLTRYAPGTRENGAVYTHAATWAIVATAMLGRAEVAYSIFSKINPVVRSARPKKYCAEPYVTAGNIDGPDSPFYGRGGWTWYSGSAAWLWKAGFEYILGVRPSRQGLIVAPCIPSKWRSYRVQRRFRGAHYKIEIQNPDAVSRGIRSILVDGTPMEHFHPSTEVVLPVFPKDSLHEILATLGP